MNIDCHAHYVPPAVLERVTADGASFGVSVGEDTPQGPRLRLGKDGPLARPILGPARDLPKRRETVAETHIDRQILSAWMDVVGYMLPTDHCWFYYDTIVFEADVLEFLLAEVGADRVLMSSDCPFGIGDPNPTAIIEQVKLSSGEKGKILGGNAALLFGL